MISELRDYLFQKGLPYGLQPLSVMVGPDPTCPSDGYSLHLETRGGPTGKADFGLNTFGRSFTHIPEEDFPEIHRRVCEQIEAWWSDLPADSFLPVAPDWPLRGEYEWRRAKAFEGALATVNPLKDTGWQVDAVRCVTELSAAARSNPLLNCPKFYESFGVTLRTPWGDDKNLLTGMQPGGSTLEVFRTDVERQFYETVVLVLPISSIGPLPRPNLLVQKALNYVVRPSPSAEAVDARFHEADFRCKARHLSTLHSLDVTAEYTYARDCASEPYLLGKSQVREDEVAPAKPLGEVVNELVSQLLRSIEPAAPAMPAGPAAVSQPSPFWLDPADMSRKSKPRYDNRPRLDSEKLIRYIERALLPGRKLPAAWSTSCRQVESISCNSPSFDRAQAFLEFTLKNPTSYPSIKYQVAIGADSSADDVLEDLRAQLVATDRWLPMGDRSFLDTRHFIEAEVARRLGCGDFQVAWNDDKGPDAELQVGLILNHNASLRVRPGYTRTAHFSVLVWRPTVGGVGKVIDDLCAQVCTVYDVEDRGRAPVSSQPQPLSTPAPALAVSSAAAVVPGFTADRNGELFTKWRELAVDNFRMHRQLERLTRFDRSPVGPDVRYEVDPSTAAWVPRPPPNEAALRANIVTESIEFTRLTRLLREVEQSQTKTRR